MADERTAASPSPPIFVAGIGPPLSQIEEDMRELVDSTCGGIAQDALALIAEVERLRGVLERISRQSYSEAIRWGSRPAQVAERALRDVG